MHSNVFRTMCLYLICSLKVCIKSNTTNQVNDESTSFYKKNFVMWNTITTFTELNVVIKRKYNIYTNLFVLRFATACFPVYSLVRSDGAANLLDQ